MKRKREDEDGVPNNSIYWAKIKGYPWWPAMVTNDGLREYWRVKNSNVEYFCLSLASQCRAIKSTKLA